jgi:hypothetical protein
LKLLFDAAQLALLLLVHLIMILTGTLTFTVESSLRCLQPVSVLYILGIALCLPAFLNGEPPEEAAVS